MIESVIKTISYSILAIVRVLAQHSAYWLFIKVDSNQSKKDAI
jgi:uncharacterized membrane protein